MYFFFFIYFHLIILFYYYYFYFFALLFMFSNCDTCHFVSVNSKQHAAKNGGYMHFAMYDKCEQQNLNKKILKKIKNNWP